MFVLFVIIDHQDQLTFPEPAVRVVTLLEPTVAVVPVKPEPMVIV